MATRVFTAEDRIPVAAPPYGFEFQAYSAGKAAALNAVDAFVRDRATSFDVVSIHIESGAPVIELFQNAFDAL